jgi:hypothetical protein
VADSIGELQSSELESRFETRRIERFQWFLAVAVVALVLIELIPERLKEKSARSGSAPTALPVEESV